MPCSSAGCAAAAASALTPCSREVRTCERAATVYALPSATTSHIVFVCRVHAALACAAPCTLSTAIPSGCHSCSVPQCLWRWYCSLPRPALALRCCMVWSICSRSWMALTQQSTSAGGGGEISQGRGRYCASCAGTGSGSTAGTAGATAGAASTAAAAATVKLAGSGTPLEQTCSLDVEVQVAARTPSPMSLSVETGLRTACPSLSWSARL